LRAWIEERRLHLLLLPIVDACLRCGSAVYGNG
jgi:hypothetical protein